MRSGTTLCSRSCAAIQTSTGIPGFNNQQSLESKKHQFSRVAHIDLIFYVLSLIDCVTMRCFPGLLICAGKKSGLFDDGDGDDDGDDDDDDNSNHDDDDVVVVAIILITITIHSLSFQSLDHAVPPVCL